jgi:hypothetical protein
MYRLQNHTSSAVHLHMDVKLELHFHFVSQVKSHIPLQALLTHWCQSKSSVIPLSQNENLHTQCLQAKLQVQLVLRVKLHLHVTIAGANLSTAGSQIDFSWSHQPQSERSRTRLSHGKN